MSAFDFHHVGIAVHKLREAIEQFATLFEYQLVSGPFDDPIQKVSVCFLSRREGDTVLELVAPLEPDSPIERILRRGGGTYHVCYEVADIDAALRRLSDQGCMVVSGPVPAVAFDMRKIAWLMTDVGLLVELLEADASASPT